MRPLVEGKSNLESNRNRAKAGQITVKKRRLELDFAHVTYIEFE